MRPNQATMKEPKPTLAALLGKENLNRAWESLRGNMGVTGPNLTSLFEKFRLLFINNLKKFCLLHSK